MQEENTENQNGFGGFSNFAPETKSPEVENTWNAPNTWNGGKGSDSIWNSGKN
jgi:hypothetical protein